MFSIQVVSAFGTLGLYRATSANAALFALLFETIFLCIFPSIIVVIFIPFEVFFFLLFFFKRMIGRISSLDQRGNFNTRRIGEQQEPDQLNEWILSVWFRRCELWNMPASRQYEVFISFSDHHRHMSCSGLDFTPGA